LARSQDGVEDSIFRENFEGFGVDGGFGQPHAFGAAFEAMFEVGDAPFDLGNFIAAVGQRKNHVVVGLRDRGTVAAKFGGAQTVGFEEGFVNARGLVFHPGK